MTGLRNTATTWGSLARALHWLSALLVLFLTGYGWWMTHVAARAGRLQLYQFHSVIGWYLLLLIALRLLWRAANPPPALPATLPRWERSAAHAMHWVLYLLLLVVSVAGWMVADTFRQPIEATLFGMIPVPHLLDASHRPYRDLVEGTHAVASYLLLALALIHIASALRHHFVWKNDVLHRMGWGA